MVQSPVKVMTLAEFLLIPETKPANEFIDGQIIQKPMPQGKHSAVDRSTQVFDEEIDILPVPKFAKDFQLGLGELFGWLRD